MAYDGTSYHGWQIQPNGISVQEVLQKALATLLRQPVSITGAGRTDTGVHARMMVAHFDFEYADDPVRRIDGRWLTDKLNRLLPPDISIYKTVPVVADAHARFDALSRTYHYYLHFGKSPFLRAYSCRLYRMLDFEKMNEAAAALFDYTDFTSFSKVNTDTKTNNCRIMQARWTELAPGEWRFEIQADRFCATWCVPSSVRSSRWGGASLRRRLPGGDRRKRPLPGWRVHAGERPVLSGCGLSGQMFHGRE